MVTGFFPATLLEASVGVVAVALGWVFGLQPAASLGLSVSGISLGLVATLPMLGGFVALRKSQWPALKQIRESLEEMIPFIIPDPSLPRLALISTVAGLGEELFFRGLIQGGLAKTLGDGTGLIVASLLFGLAHPVSRAYVVIASVIGVYLGGLWLISGSLLIPVVAHAAYDFCALVIITSELRLRRGRQPHI